MKRTIIGFIIFSYISMPIFCDRAAYSEKVRIEIESENYRIIHVHDWSLSTKNERHEMMISKEQDPFRRSNNFAYIECIDKRIEKIVFHIPTSAFTHLFISENENYIAGISNIMLDNPYQLIIITITGDIIKKRHITSEEARMRYDDFTNFKNKFQSEFQFLQSRKRIFYIDSYYYIDFLGMSPVLLGNGVFKFLLKYIHENHLSNNFSQSVTNWVFWFNESNPDLLFNYKNKELYSISILDQENKRIEIPIMENNM
ncbi:MAG: hypothetical protein Ta2B_20460 [Termitinemataceae bacterium]|nr:MAG: hypothetical protein Ta2B_20460 [Termitinemataceae bacterium]